jgi:hypothetical protein
MNTHSFLSLIQKNYDFTRANCIFSELNLKNSWKDWLTAELVHLCNDVEPFSDIQIGSHYPGAVKKDGSETFLRCRPGKSVERLRSKASASRCDFSVCNDGARHHFEIRCGNSLSFSKNKELSKYEADIERVSAIKKANPAVNVSAIFAFYGAFSTQDAKVFSVLDNSRRCTYVLDSSLTGSSGIARLSHMKKAGEPRVCLAVYTAVAR